MLHFAAYTILGVLFLRAFMTMRIKNNLKMVMILSILSSSLYGISDEIHQHYVPFRNAELMDALADILGSIVGVFVYHTIVKLKNPT
jgi:VanZ family protein